jgi:hypothetical protein
VKRAQGEHWPGLKDGRAFIFEPLIAEMLGRMIAPFLWFRHLLAIMLITLMTQPGLTGSLQMRKRCSPISMQINSKRVWRKGDGFHLSVYFLPKALKRIGCGYLTSWQSSKVLHRSRRSRFLIIGGLQCGGTVNAAFGVSCRQISKGETISRERKTRHG